MNYYVTRYARKYKGRSFNKIKQSLRSFHFDTYESARPFFDSLDKKQYCAKLKYYDENGKSHVLLSL